MPPTDFQSELAEMASDCAALMQTAAVTLIDPAPGAYSASTGVRATTTSTGSVTAIVSDVREEVGRGGSGGGGKPPVTRRCEIIIDAAEIAAAGLGDPRPGWTARAAAQTALDNGDWSVVSASRRAGGRQWQLGLEMTGGRP